MTARFEDLLFHGGFAVGLTKYASEYPGNLEDSRIVVSASVEGRQAVQTVLDTGAPWCVVDPELAVEWELDIREGYAPGRPLCIQGISVNGRLVRASIALLADRGQDLIIEGTIFVPVLRPGETWRFPNFIGLEGFLSRIRFAVDPAESTLYFGGA